MVVSGETSLSITGWSSSPPPSCQIVFEVHCRKKRQAAAMRKIFFFLLVLLVFFFFSHAFILTVADLRSFLLWTFLICLFFFSPSFLHPFAFNATPVRLVADRYYKVTLLGLFLSVSLPTLTPHYKINAHILGHKHTHVHHG